MNKFVKSYKILLQYCLFLTCVFSGFPAIFDKLDNYLPLPAEHCEFEHQRQPSESAQSRQQISRDSTKILYKIEGESTIRKHLNSADPLPNNTKSVEISNHKDLQESLFDKCENLTTLKISNTNLRKLSSLSKLKKLETIELKECAGIQPNLFDSCTNLTTLKITNTDISNLRSLSQLKKITEVKLIDCTNIQEDPFNKCINLKTLCIKKSDIKNLSSLPDNLETIDLDNCDKFNPRMFDRCSKIKKLTINGTEFYTEQPTYNKEDQAKMKNICLSKCDPLPSHLQSLELDNCIGLQKNLFDGCNNLTRMKITGDCNNLTDRLSILPTSITSIELENCTNIHKNLFTDCKLTTLKIHKTDLSNLISLPASVTSIELEQCTGRQPNIFDECTNLKNLKIDGIEVCLNPKLEIKEPLEIENEYLNDASSLTNNPKSIVINNCKCLKQNLFDNCTESVACLTIINTNLINLKSLSQLKKITEVKLVDCTNIQPDLLDNCTEITTLTIQNTNIEELTSLPYNLSSIEFINCKKIPAKLFDKCAESLKSLIIINTNLINLKSLPKLEKLKFIKLENCIDIKPDLLDKCSNIKTLIIKNINIGKLTSITASINSSVTSIELEQCTGIQPNIFDECTNLKNLKIDGIEVCLNPTFEIKEPLKIEEKYLNDASSLTNKPKSIVINNCKCLKQNLFDNCTESVECLTIINTNLINLTSLSKLKKLGKVTLIDCTNIHPNLFKKCATLGNITISNTKINYLPKKTTTFELDNCSDIQPNLLNKCSKLQNLILKKTNITKLGNLPEKLEIFKTLELYDCTDINQEFLDKCSNIKTLIINDRSIKNFRYLTALEKISLNLSNKQTLFYKCNKLEKLIINSEENILKNPKDGKYTLENEELNNDDLLSAQIKSIVINSCTGIQRNLFHNCTNLKTLKITGDSYSKTDLSNLSALPDSLETIELHNCRNINPNLFDNCPNLTTLTINITDLINLKSLPRLNNLTSIELDWCTNINPNLFDKCPNLKTLKINYTDISNLRSLPASLTYIKLENCSGIKKNLFEHCSNLKTLKITNTNLSNLSSLPYSLTSIELHNCRNIQPNLFDSCTNLTTLKINYTDISNLRSLPANLTYIELKNCKKIEPNRFDLCTNLKTLKIAKDIDESIFDRCSNLKTLEINNCSKVDQKTILGYCKSLKRFMIDGRDLNIQRKSLAKPYDYNYIKYREYSSEEERHAKRQKTFQDPNNRRRHSSSDLSRDRKRLRIS